MKNKLKTIQEILFLTIICLSSFSCSNSSSDNEPEGIVEIENLEGTWALIRSTGIVHTSGYTWDREYDIDNPATPQVILEITKSNPEIYHISVTESHDYGNWHREYETDTQLEHHTLIGIKDPLIRFFIQTLTKDRLITYQYDTDTEDDKVITYEETKTFVRIK
jgi:hypothetical protein